MTSNINFAAINENFPVAGQDNDTQVFRDNFDTIKTNFSAAKTEIEDLQDNVARTDQTNDFNSNSITNAKFINNFDVVYNYQTQPNPLLNLEYENGPYQILSISQTDFTLGFLNFPKDGNTVGKVTLELYADNSLISSTKKISFSLSGTGATVKKKSGFPAVIGGSHDFELSSTSDPIIIEIWRHSESTFFMRYVGSFS